MGHLVIHGINNEIIVKIMVNSSERIFVLILMNGASSIRNANMVWTPYFYPCFIMALNTKTRMSS